MGLVGEKIRFATFDCYGTLIDWEGGAASFLYELARRHEPEPPPAQELRDRWEALQFERLQGRWCDYRAVLADSLAELAGERGWRWNARDGEALARSMESWQPFPDTDVEFDGVTVAEDCRAYKPSRAPFERALHEIGLPPGQILHVAFGFKYDITPGCGPSGSTAARSRRPAMRAPTSNGPTCGLWLDLAKS